MARTFYFHRYDFDPEQFAGSSIPMLVIGTKLDLAETVRDTKMQRSSSISDEVGADEINVVRKSYFNNVTLLYPELVSIVYLIDPL